MQIMVWISNEACELAMNSALAKETNFLGSELDRKLDDGWLIPVYMPSLKKLADLAKDLGLPDSTTLDSMLKLIFSPRA